MYGCCKTSPSRVGDRGDFRRLPFRGQVGSARLERRDLHVAPEWGRDDRALRLSRLPPKSAPPGAGRASRSGRNRTLVRSRTRRHGARRPSREDHRPASGGSGVPRTRMPDGRNVHASRDDEEVRSGSTTDIARSAVPRAPPHDPRRTLRRAASLPRRGPSTSGALVQSGFPDGLPAARIGGSGLRRMSRAPRRGRADIGPRRPSASSRRVALRRGVGAIVPRTARLRSRALGRSIDGASPLRRYGERRLVLSRSAGATVR
jgi:hypothetical protein